MLDTYYNHPLYQRVKLKAWYSEGRYQILERLYIMLIVTVLVVVAAVFGMVYSILLLHGIIFLPFISIFFGGAALAPAISRAIVRIREEGAYDLLCMTPGGAIHINWLIATGFIYHASQRPSKIHGVGAWVKLAGWLVISGGFLLLAGWWQIPFWRITYDLIVILVLVAVFVYLHNIQSLLLACLVGMLIPTVVQRLHDAQLWAAMSIIALQVAIYTLTTFVLIAATRLFGSGLLTTAAVAATTTIATLYILREIAIVVLWKLLLRRLQVSPIEAQLVVL